VFLKASRYIYISVPLFNDRLEKEIDDWLHVMKYDEVPKNYHSPYMVQVAEKLNILKMTQEERANYSYYQKKLYNDRDELQVAEARGKEEGIEIGEARGKTEGKTEIALAMLLDGDSAEKVARITGLSIADIQKLRS
jgi:predicted transposase/invertase (TIGR01784 family)